MLKNFQRLSILYAILIFTLFLNCEAQTKKFIAIIPPLHSRNQLGSLENPLQLSKQQFILFVYPNAVAVYSESTFINQSNNMVNQEMALPSTGHFENKNEPNNSRISNGILNIELWIQGKKVSPQQIHDGGVDWFTIQTKFAPHQTQTIKTLFWAETSLTDIDSIPGLNTTLIKPGKRAFLINLAHAAIWNNRINAVDISVVFKDSILHNSGLIKATPSSYDIKDSAYTWSMNNIEPTHNDNIFILYNSGNTSDSNMSNMSQISHYIKQTVYDQLIYFAAQLNEL